MDWFNIHFVHRGAAPFLFFALMLGGFWLWARATGTIPMRNGKDISAEDDPRKFGCWMAILFWGMLVNLAIVLILLVVP